MLSRVSLFILFFKKIVLIIQGLLLYYVKTACHIFQNTAEILIEINLYL